MAHTGCPGGPINSLQSTIVRSSIIFFFFFFLSMIFLAVRNAKDTKSSNIKNASDKHVPVY